MRDPRFRDQAVWRTPKVISKRLFRGRCPPGFVFSLHSSCASAAFRGAYQPMDMLYSREAICPCVWVRSSHVSVSGRFRFWRVLLSLLPI